MWDSTGLDCTRLVTRLDSTGPDWTLLALVRPFRRASGERAYHWRWGWGWGGVACGGGATVVAAAQVPIVLERSVWRAEGGADEPSTRLAHRQCSACEGIM